MDTRKDLGINNSKAYDILTEQQAVRGARKSLQPNAVHHQSQAALHRNSTMMASKQEPEIKRGDTYFSNRRESANNESENVRFEKAKHREMLIQNNRKARNNLSINFSA